MNGATESSDAALPIDSDDVSEAMSDPAPETPGPETENAVAEEADLTPEPAVGPESEPMDLDAQSEPLTPADGLTAELLGLQDAIAEEAAGADVDEAAGADVDEAAGEAPVAESGESEEPSESEGESLDDITPGTVAAETNAGDAEAVAAATVEVTVPRATVTSWPFIGYVVIWLIAAGLGVWQFLKIPANQAVFETDLYRMSMLAALVMLAAGPVLLIIVWFASWIGRKGVRVGSMFVSAFLKGASAKLIGAIIWWGALLLVDYLRLGRLY